MSPGKKYPDEEEFPVDQSGAPVEETLGDSEPFSRFGSRKEEPPSSSAPGKPTRVPELKAIVLGPPGSGKSSFIGALQRSLIANPSAVVRRCLYKAPHSGGTSEVGNPNEEPSGAFGEIGVERFYVELAQSPRGVELTLHESTGNDSPEGPVEHGGSSAWAAQARGAQLLVLCVDAGTGQRDYWLSTVEQIVRDLTWLEEDPGAKDSEAELRGILPIPSSGRIHCLPFKRVLFLLSKIDLLFERALETQSGYGFLRLIAAQESSQLAHALDPVPQLCNLLGTSTVGKVLHAVQEEAEVAVAATSSRGMGSIFLDLHRGGRRSRCTAGLTDGPLLGIKEALEFLVTGHCTAPVARLSRSSLQRNRFVQLL